VVREARTGATSRTRPGSSSSGDTSPHGDERGASGSPTRSTSSPFTHLCGKTRSGRFWLRRITISKRMRAKLREVNDQLKRRRHRPIPMQGHWLASVVRGHLAYYAVPGNTDADNGTSCSAGS
jgi:hypothetical protein